MADAPTHQDEAHRPVEGARQPELSFRRVTSVADAGPGLRWVLVECWVEVSNAGDAAGFPYSPIDATHAASALDRILSGLDPQTSRLLTAWVGGELAGVAPHSARLVRAHRALGAPCITCRPAPTCVAGVLERR